MRLEERITAALRAEADDTEVDVQRLYVETAARLDPRPGRGRTLMPFFAAATTVVVLVVGALAVSQNWFSPGPQRQSSSAAVPIEGGVSRAFTCPIRDTYDFVHPSRGQEDDFLPSLAGGPQAAAEEFGAARYVYRESDGTATLWLGEPDGSLASTATFTRISAGWRLRGAERCSEGNATILTNGPGRLQLGLHGHTPWPAQGMTGDGDGMPVLIDDRSYYGDGGVVEHRSIYAAPCAERLCLAAGRPTSMVLDDIRMRADSKPYDISSMFLPPDDMEGRTNPFGLWALYDNQGKVTKLTVSMKDGSTRTAEPFNGADWTGTVFVALATFDEVKSVDVTTTEGGSAAYLPKELPGYQPR